MWSGFSVLVSIIWQHCKCVGCDRPEADLPKIKARQLAMPCHISVACGTNIVPPQVLEKLWSWTLISSQLVNLQSSYYTTYMCMFLFGLGVICWGHFCNQYLSVISHFMLWVILVISQLLKSAVKGVIDKLLWCQTSMLYMVKPSWQTNIRSSYMTIIDFHTMCSLHCPLPACTWTNVSEKLTFQVWEKVLKYYY